MAQIMFVDDDPLTLETLSKAVQLFGHQRLSASEGRKALALAVENLPDLIFVDMFLPDMDGLSLVSELQAEAATAHIPVLVLSAGPELTAAEQAKAAGARAYLNKPVRLQNLLDIIEQYTAGT